MNKQDLQASFAAIGYDLTFSESKFYPGWVVACCIKKDSKGLKPVFNYRYSTEEKMISGCEYQLNSLKKIVEAREGRKNRKAEARKNLENPFKLGDILYDAWGYEQTNIDFYQVVEVKSKSVVIRPIGEEIVPGSCGFMCEKVRPAKDSFTGEPMKKVLQVGGTYSETTKPYYFISSRHGSISPYTYGNDGIYQSHYA